MKIFLAASAYLLPIGAAAGIAYLFWGILLHWIIAQIPAGASWAFLAKLASIVAVGYLGGVALPLGVLIFGCIVITGIISAVMSN